MLDVARRVSLTALIPRSCRVLSLAIVWAIAGFLPAPSRICEGLPGFDRLDFWVGEWDVLVAGERAGENRIEKILSGCAVVDHWRGAGGGEGHSLFFYDHVTGVWKQVWITDNATAPAGLKEKTLIEEGEDGSLLFQGSVTLADGRTFLDRTTLTPLEDGGVRQVIAISANGGDAWQQRFDGTDVRRPPRRPE